MERCQVPSTLDLCSLPVSGRLGPAAGRPHSACRLGPAQPFPSLISSPDKWVLGTFPAGNRAPWGQVQRRARSGSSCLRPQGLDLKSCTYDRRQAALALPRWLRTRCRRLQLPSPFCCVRHAPWPAFPVARGCPRPGLLLSSTPGIYMVTGTCSTDSDLGFAVKLCGAPAGPAVCGLAVL